METTQIQSVPKRFPMDVTSSIPSQLRGSWSVTQDKYVSAPKPLPQTPTPVRRHEPAPLPPKGK